MNIVFFGSDDFALVSLKELLGSAHRVLACVTQPDKPKGRHLKVIFSDVKQESLREKIPVLQPEDLKDKDFMEELKNLNADLFVVVAFGRFMPQKLIDLPKIFSINVHASLLPQYRGAAPMNWALVNGEKKTGVSIMKVISKMDAGDIIAQEQEEIGPDDTAVSLRKNLSKRGAQLLLKTIDSIERGTYSLKRQDESNVTYAPKLTKKDGLINWGYTASRIHNMVRGLTPWPSAFTHFNGKSLKILETEVLDPNLCQGKPGEIIEVVKKELLVSTGKGILGIKRLHLEAARPMDAKSFIAGHKVEAGTYFK